MSTTLAARAVSPSEAVVERVAASEGVEPTALQPLFEVIDPEAVDALVEAADRPDSPLSIDFTYHGHEVSIDAAGVVDVEETG